MRRALSISLALALCATAPVVLAASPPPAAKQAYTAPRNAFGQPDLTGSWTNAFLTPLTRPASFGTRAAYTEAEVKEMEDFQKKHFEDGKKPIDNTKLLTEGVIQAKGGLGAQGNQDNVFLDPGMKVGRVNGVPRTSILTTPDGQVPPRKAGAPAPPARQQRNILNDRSNGLFDNPEQVTIAERCIMFGNHAPLFPNGIYNQNYQIVQTRDVVAIESEMIHDTRIVKLNGTHRPANIRPYMGDSIGHYEGDTLVVETTNIPESQAVFGSWKDLTITERFKRVGPDRLLYQFQISDPTLWDKPFGGEYEFSTLNGRLMEYACHEGNYGLEGILAGAREQDAKEEAAKKRAATGG
jgi:hypothetical protein